MRVDAPPRNVKNLGHPREARTQPRRPALPSQPGQSRRLRTRTSKRVVTSPGRARRVHPPRSRDRPDRHGRPRNGAGHTKMRGVNARGGLRFDGLNELPHQFLDCSTLKAGCGQVNSYQDPLGGLDRERRASGQPRGRIGRSGGTTRIGRRLKRRRDTFGFRVNGDQQLHPGLREVGRRSNQRPVGGTRIRLQGRTFGLDQRLNP